MDAFGLHVATVTGFAGKHMMTAGEHGTQQNGHNHRSFVSAAIRLKQRGE